MNFPLYGLLTTKRALKSSLPNAIMLYDIRTDVAIPILRFFAPAWDNLSILTGVMKDGNYIAEPILEDDLVLISYNRNLEGYPVADLLEQAEMVSDLTRIADKSKQVPDMAMSMNQDFGEGAESFVN